MRLLIADDHPLFRDGLRSLLEAHGMEIVAEAENGAKAVELSRTYLPDVVLMDVGMPVVGGIEAARILGREIPTIRVVMLTAAPDEVDRGAAFEAGAVAYACKDVTFDKLVELINTATSDNQVRGLFSETLAKVNTQRVSGYPGLAPWLTDFEQRVLEQMASGRTSTRILATGLEADEASVRYAVRSILQKFDLHSRAELVALLVRRDLSDRCTI